MQVNYADYQSGRFADAPAIYTPFQLHHSADGMEAAGRSRDGPIAATVPTPTWSCRHRFARATSAMCTSTWAPPTWPSATCAYSATPMASRRPHQRDVTAKRDKDRRNAVVTWTAVPGAVGYNVRWGLRADRLNLSYQVFADKGTALELRALNVDPSYAMAVEAFNENGVSGLSAVKLAE